MRLLVQFVLSLVVFQKQVSCNRAVWSSSQVVAREAVGSHGSVGGDAGMLIGVGHGVGGQGRVQVDLGVAGSSGGVQVRVICCELRC